MKTRSPLAAIFQALRSRRGVMAVCMLLAFFGVAPAEEAAVSRVPVATTSHFAFFSDLDTNLNDALIVAGQARNADSVELFASGEEQACFDRLAPSARSGWEQAVDWYSEILSPVDWSDRQQFLLRRALGRFGGKKLDDRAERFVSIARGFLATASPAYEACRWPAQDAQNRTWISEMVQLLATHEANIGRRLERHYGTPWHGLPLPVDVVPTAPSKGANSIILSPSGGHILISSTIGGLVGLETVFHEASHTLVAPWKPDPLPEQLQQAAKKLDRQLPRDLWHVVLFYTTGETVRQVLEDADVRGYKPYVEDKGLWAGRWGEYRQAIERIWPAYMAGERTLEEAAHALVEAIGTPDRKGG